MGKSFSSYTVGDMARGLNPLFMSDSNRLEIAECVSYLDGMSTVNATIKNTSFYDTFFVSEMYKDITKVKEFVSTNDEFAPAPMEPIENKIDAGKMEAVLSYLPRYIKSEYGETEAYIASRISDLKGCQSRVLDLIDEIAKSREKLSQYKNIEAKNIIATKVEQLTTGLGSAGWMLKGVETRSSDNTFTFVYKDRLSLSDKNLSLKVDRSFDIGWWMMSVSASLRSIRLFPLISARRGSHPHVNNEGRPCWGTWNERMPDLISDGSWGLIGEAATSLLTTLGGSPYISYDNYKKLEVRENPSGKSCTTLNGEAAFITSSELINHMNFTDPSLSEDYSNFKKLVDITNRVGAVVEATAEVSSIEAEEGVFEW